MSARDDGGPAFPHTAADGHKDYRRGLSMRDYFAAAAVHGLLANGHRLDDVERVAYAVADAMIEVRKR